MANSIPTAFKNREVALTFDNYPDELYNKLLYLRQLIFSVANELGISPLEETLKWGEPSYLAKNGSTIRIAWRKSKPEEYGLFFNCKTSLIETFRGIYHDTFRFEGNRAIIFNKADGIPVDALKHCIELSLTYHKIKHLPQLGI